MVRTCGYTYIESTIKTHLWSVLAEKATYQATSVNTVEHRSMYADDVRVFDVEKSSGFLHEPLRAKL